MKAGLTVAEIFPLKDAITVGDIIALITALAGVAIVVGSFVLLYKGIITLQAVNEAARRNAPDPTAIAIQIGDKIKIQSQYPTIVLFILGIVCLFGAIYMDVQIAPTLMDVQGKVVDKGKYTFTFTGAMGVVKPDKDGFFHKIVPKDIELLEVQVGKAGSDPDIIVVYPSKRENGILSLGVYPAPTPSTDAVKPTNVAVPKPTIDQSQIAPTPPNMPPLISK